MVFGARFHIYEFDRMSDPYPSPSLNYKFNERAFLYKCLNCGDSGKTLVFGDEKYKGDLVYAAAEEPLNLKYDKMDCPSRDAPFIWFFDLHNHNCLVNRKKLFDK